MSKIIYILGGSEISEEQLLAIPSHASVAVFNDGYRKYPTADYCFFQDASFYERIKGEDFRKFAGRVFSILFTDNERIELLTDADIAIGKGKKKFSAMGKNTGFHAICWALNQGYEHVYLLGFECKYKWGSQIMPEVFDAWQNQHRELAALKLPITNLTPNSGIDAYNTFIDGE